MVSFLLSKSLARSETMKLTLTAAIKILGSPGVYETIFGSSSLVEEDLSLGNSNLSLKPFIGAVISARDDVQLQWLGLNAISSLIMPGEWLIKNSGGETTTIEESFLDITRRCWILFARDGGFDMFRVILERYGFSKSYGHAVSYTLEMMDFILEHVVNDVVLLSKVRENFISAFHNDYILHDFTRHRDFQVQLKSFKILKNLFLLTDPVDLKRRQQIALEHGSVLWQLGNSVIADDPQIRSEARNLLDLFSFCNSDIYSLLSNCVPMSICKVLQPGIQAAKMSADSFINNFVTITRKISLDKSENTEIGSNSPKTPVRSPSLKKIPSMNRVQTSIFKEINSEGNFSNVKSPSNRSPSGTRNTLSRLSKQLGFGKGNSSEINISRTKMSSSRSIASIISFLTLSRKEIGLTDWPQFFKLLNSDINTEKLVWNSECKKEFISSITTEIIALDGMRKYYNDNQKLWDWAGFSIEYKSLKDCLIVGGYFLDLFPSSMENGSYLSDNEAKKFISSLYGALVVEDKVSNQKILIKCMKIVCSHHQSTINVFPISYLVKLFKPHTADPHLFSISLELFVILLSSFAQVKRFVDRNGLEYLFTYLNRSYVDQLPSIESKEDFIHVDKYIWISNLINMLELITEYYRPQRSVADKYLVSLIHGLLLPGKFAHRILGILIKVLRGDPTKISSLWKTGCFDFVYPLLDPDTSESKSFHSPEIYRVIDFLREFHIKQLVPLDPLKDFDKTSFVSGISGNTLDILKYRFHSSLIYFLDNEDSEEFATALSEEYSGVSLYWNKDLTNQLLNDSKAQIQSFKKKWSSELGAKYSWVLPESSLYPILDREIIVGGFRISFYIESKSKRTVPSNFVALLVERQRHEKEKSRQLECLQAQLEVYKRWPNSIEVSSVYPGLDFLHDLYADIDTVKVTKDNKNILEKQEDLILTMMENVLKNPVNINEWDGYLSMCSLIGKHCREHRTSSLLTRSFELFIKIISTYSKNIIQIYGYNMKEYGLFIYSICQILENNSILENESILPLVFDLLEIIISTSTEEGFAVFPCIFVYLLDFAAFNGNEGEQKVNNLCIRAANYIVNLVQLSDNISNAFTNILPYGLVDLIVDGESFAINIRTNHYTPVRIWNEDCRKELYNLVQEEKERFGEPINVNNWSIDNFTNFTYKSLANEMVVYDIFIKIFNESPHVEVSDPGGLLIELFRQIFSSKWTDLIHLSLLERAIMNLSHQRAALLTGLSEVLFPHLLTLEVGIDKRYWGFQILRNLSSITEGLEAVVEVGFIPVCQLILNSKDSDMKDVINILKLLASILSINSSMQIIKIFMNSGAMVSVIKYIIIGDTKHSEYRRISAQILGSLCPLKDDTGGFYLKTLETLFHSEFLKSIKNASSLPDEFLNLYDSNINTPVLIWNEESRSELKTFILSEMNSLLESPEKNWDYKSLSTRYEHKSFSSQLSVDSIYIRPFNEEPFYVLENFDGFLTSLLKRIWNWEDYVKNESKKTELLQILEAILNLLGVRAHLQLLDSFLDSIPQLFSVFKLSGEWPNFQIGILSILKLISGSTEDLMKMQEPNIVVCLLKGFSDSIELKHAWVTLVLEIVQKCSFDQATQFNEHFRDAGGLCYLLVILLHPEYDNEIIKIDDKEVKANLRKYAAEIILSLVADLDSGKSVSNVLCKMISPDLGSVLSSKPEKIISFLDNPSDSWSNEKKVKVKNEIEKSIKEINMEFLSRYNGISNKWKYT